MRPCRHGVVMSAGFILALGLTLGTIVAPAIACAILSWMWRAVTSRPTPPPYDLWRM